VGAGEDGRDVVQGKETHGIARLPVALATCGVRKTFGSALSRKSKSRSSRMVAMRHTAHLLST